VIDTYDYAGLKELAKSLRRPSTTLVALAPQNDPFYADMPSRRAMAEWFAGLWERFGLQRGIHLRAVHYKLISQRTPITFPNGTAYENTIECWKELGKASKDARHLELVTDEWTDRKSSSIVHLVDPTTASISLIDGQGYDYDAPTAMPDLPRLHLDPPSAPHPYHVELWCEKATVNDILMSLAQRYGLNVVTGEGEISVTRCVELVDRAVSSDRPVRILYVSDFDPAGQSMPVAVARKIEHVIHRRDLDIDVQVRPVALTKRQCQDYDLPRTPIKEEERRKKGFEERHGEGATELDALEALHPGVLRQILIDEIERYYDPDLKQATEDAAEELERELDDITESAYDAHRAEIDELTAAWAEITTAMEAWKRRAQPVWRGIAESLTVDAPNPDDHDWPEAREANEDDDPLFDSTRDYIDQMGYYKEFQGKPTERRKRSE
jgi:hypothetical protein